MASKLIKKFKDLSRSKRIKVVIASVLTLALIVALPVAAWFTNQRRLADLQYVNSPSKLYIRAGHDEESQYIDLSNVQVTAASENAKYYVFAVTGSNANYYNLQLAYTTNNQFEYFLYPAKELDEIPAGDVLYVPYTAHSDTGTDGNYYYVIDNEIIDSSDNRMTDGVSITRHGETKPIKARYLNKDGELIKAKKTAVDGVDYHTSTYNYDAENVQDCAEPLYWQVRNIKSGMNTTTRELIDYYILEVNWEKAKQQDLSADPKREFTDNRETDVIYISVASSTGNDE